MPAAATAVQTAQSFMDRLGADSLEALMGSAQKTELRTAEVNTKIDEMEAGLQDAMLQKEERLKQARLKIVAGNAARLQEAIEEEERDLAKAMVGLKELMARIGIDYQSLTEPSAEEKAIVSNAESALRQREVDLEMAKRALADAEQSFFLGRNGRVMKAQDKITLAEGAIDAAKANIESAKKRSQELTRARLMSATLDKSLQHYITQVGRVITIMEDRQKTIDGQLVKVSQRRAQALKLKQEASLMVEKLDGELNKMEASLKLAQDELAALTNGSPEYVAKETEVSNLSNQVEEVRGKRNTALGVFNSKERFAQELQIHETSQRKLRDNQRIWIAVLKSDTQERLVTFGSRLEAMKGISDQQVAQGVDRIGTEIDGRNAEVMAEAGSASDNVRQEMFESQPLRIRRIMAAMGAQQEAIAAMRQREQEAIAAFRSQYGIDPKAGSFFNYDGALATA